MKFPTIKSKKDSLYITLFFLFSIACIAGLRYEQRLEMQKGIAEKIIRFHVIANSDTKADQDLKLAVRDAVGIKMSGLLKDAADRSRSEAVIRKNMEDMKQTAEKVIAERGYDYDVDICLTDTDFPVKTYGAYTFPAGNYEALEIVIGAGKGHNWWCVMYPNMCFSDTMYEVIDEDARSSLKRVLSEDEYQQVLASGDYQVKFKSFEILKGLYVKKQQEMRIRMTKEVLVTISGLQFSPETESESVELITSGSYYKKNGKHYIIYDEVNEGFSETTRNIIKLNDDFMDITRRGVSNVHMMFEKNRKNVTYYYTPYGSLLIGIDAKSVDVQETENDIDVKVNYELEVNYEHMADCCITMNIKSKDAGDFRITGAE